MLSNKQIASLLILSVAVCICAADYDWEDLENTNDDSQAENPFLYNGDIFFAREVANEFEQLKAEREVELLDSMVKRKHDAEEVREIEAKADARRRKAYKNYEDACKISGKFTVRSCPTLQECTAKNNQKYIPLLAQKNATTPAPPTTKPTTPTTTTAKTSSTKFSVLKPLLPILKKGRREFIERALALRFLEEELEDEFYDDNDYVSKRFFKSKNANPELTEETNERRNKAFEKYEEYCEKKKFRIGAQRHCPPLDKKKC